MPARNNGSRTNRLTTVCVLAAAAVIVTVATVVGTAAAQNSQRFGDVPSSHYAYDSVNWAVDNGITSGCGDGTNFCPEQNLNRAHMVTFLKRYHDRFGTGVTVAWSEPLDASGGVTLTGTGPNLTQAVDVTEGRWRVTLTVEGTDRLGGVSLIVLEDGSGRDLLVNELVDEDTYSQTTQFRSGSGFGDLAPGRVWFEVGVSPGVAWSVTVALL